MPFERILLFLASILFIVIGVQFDLDTGIIYLVLTLVLFAVELSSTLRLRQKLKRNPNSIASFSSFEWIGLWIFPIYVIYRILEIESSPLLIISAILIFGFGVLMSISTFYKYYLIDDTGISYLNRNKIIPAKMITEIRISDSSIAIDTSKYKNHFILDLKHLKSPSKDVLTNRLKRLWETRG